VVAGLAEKTDNPRFAYDSYRRFLDMFGALLPRCTISLQCHAAC
jgi:hypothetical protein